MVKEAMKTAEHHDSYDTVTAEAERIAGMIWNSSHCVAFTGAGISTSAGTPETRRSFVGRPASRLPIDVRLNSEQV